MITFTAFSHENSTDIIRENNKKNNKKQQSLAGLALGILRTFSLLSHIKEIT